jgi:Ca2+-transporting ATPase
MDIFASLGLATDHPSPDFLKRKPEPRNAPIITITMWKMILGQAIYQLAVVFTVHYAAWDIFDLNTKEEIEKLQTLVFNIYVWMQFFNQHNCRRVDNKLDIWYQGVLRNPWFIGVQILTLVGQFVIIFKGGEAFDTVPLTGAQWGWSMLFGILTLPLGALIRQVPDRYVAFFFHKVGALLRWITKPFRGWCSCLSVLHIRSRRRLEEAPEEMEITRKSVNNGGETMSPSKRPMSGSSRSEVSTHRRHISETLAEGASAVEEEDVDLQLLVDAARSGRSVGKNVLELHPKTLKDDPILRSRSHPNVPPSQDTGIMQFMTNPSDNEEAPVRRRLPARTVWVEPTRPAPATTAPKRGLTWESFLRSKRR